jgi:hypothetical protein
MGAENLLANFAFASASASSARVIRAMILV